MSTADRFFATMTAVFERRASGKLFADIEKRPSYSNRRQEKEENRSTLEKAKAITPKHETGERK